MTAEELWKEFCEKKNVDIDTPYDAWAFGDETIADELAALVLEGKKFGTASAYDEYLYEDELDELPQVGCYSVVLNNDEEALCVIRDYDVYLRPFGEVSPFHAYSEGEGDRTLKYWKKVHTDFFAPDLEELGAPLTDESLIVCEKFSVEYVPGRDTDDSDDLIFIEPTMNYSDEISSYRQEMLDAGSSFDGCFSMKRQTNDQEFVDYCINFDNPGRPAGKTGAWGTVLLAVRKSDRRMVGCMQVHYVLNETMKITGHVGYSVRPSERRKGYATRMLAKAKDYLSVFGFEEIIVSCLPDNEGSRRTILANGGEYINTVRFEADDVYLERYKISLK